MSSYSTFYQRPHIQGNTLHTRLLTTLIRHMDYLIGPPDGSNQFSTASIIIVSNLMVHTQVWWIQPRGLLMTLLLYKPTNRSHPRRCTDYYSVQVTWSNLSKDSVNATYTYLDATLKRMHPEFTTMQVQVMHEEILDLCGKVDIDKDHGPG